ncbi:MAG TPA: hypothetical protein VN903_08500 [Polyangia bacterium]|jgi:hypothetical protein|nr:hypothetical protein [Polyangia bacterium]
MRGARFVGLAALAGVAATAGCGKKNAGAPGAPAGAAPVAQHVDGTPHTDAAIRAWQGAGLSPEGFTTVTPVPFGAVNCDQGRVQTIDALVCEYRDQDSLTRGKTQLLEQWGREGVNTGIAFQTKLTLLGVLDRGRRDPNGKVASQVVDAFRKL